MLTASAVGQTSWRSYAHDPQHTALSQVASQCTTHIRWQTPVDLAPPYSGTFLLIHYGTPLITPANTVILPVRKSSSDDFRIEARRGSDGVLIWQQDTDYVYPPHHWRPSYGGVLSPGGRLYFPGRGGTVYYRDNVDSPAGASGQLAFFGLANYQANPTAYNASVFINTPITVDSAGNLYFGFQVTGSNPLNLVSGLARISAAGAGSRVSAATAAADATMTKVAHNCAPALSNDESMLYVGISNGNGLGFPRGYLVSLNSATLAPIARVYLRDPSSNSDALLPEDGTASPTVGPDGDVYYGVLENPFPDNNDRGWMLHFSANLGMTKTPGAFGWDDTGSIVPKSIVPSYSGSSQYLLMTKYNNYANTGTGDGVNKVAVLDPNATMVDPITGATVMKEVLTVVGPTPDPWYRMSGFPNAVREWCINTAVVDPFTRSILVNNEDGVLYRWDLTTNMLTEPVVLTAGVGEAYTPTVIGVDGTVYAINNAILFAVGTAISTDLDCDGDVDSFDFEIFTSCAKGADVVVDGVCQRSDLDHDSDADMSDFGIFQRCLGGSNVPPPAGCTN